MPAWLRSLALVETAFSPGVWVCAPFCQFRFETVCVCAPLSPQDERRNGHDGDAKGCKLEERWAESESDTV